MLVLKNARDLRVGDTIVRPRDSEVCARSYDTDVVAECRLTFDEVYIEVYLKDSMSTVSYSTKSKVMISIEPQLEIIPGFSDYDVHLINSATSERIYTFKVEAGLT